jgi:flagellar FliL protein
MILFILLAQPTREGAANVTLDDERLQDAVPKGLQKVELDLDDALFLEFEEKEEAPPPPPELPEPEALPSASLADAPAGSRRKKLWIFGIAAVICLFLGGGGTYFFMKTALDQTDKQADQAAETPQGRPAPLEPAPAETDASKGQSEQTRPVASITYALEKFQVEYTQDDQFRLLTCRLSIPGVTEIMGLELQAKSVLVRDGVYRYLRNSSLSFLNDPANADKLKADIVAVINRHLKSGQISEITFEEYVVK